VRVKGAVSPVAGLIPDSALKLKPGGAMNFRKYVPSGTSSKKKKPLELVVAMANGGLTCSSTGIPAIAPSPGSWEKSPSTSFQSVSLNEVVGPTGVWVGVGGTLVAVGPPGVGVSDGTNVLVGKPTTAVPPMPPEAIAVAVPAIATSSGGISGG